MVVSYMIVDKQCVWQQDRSPEGSDGPHCGWVQGVDNQVTMCVLMVTKKKKKLFSIIYYL